MGRAPIAWRAAYAEDLGGEDILSTAQRELLAIRLPGRGYPDGGGPLGGSGPFGLEAS